MNPIIKRTVLALTVSLVMLATANAQPRAGRGFGPGQGAGPAWSANQNLGPGTAMVLPDLTEDQKTSLQQLRTGHLQQMKNFRNQMGEISAKQRTIMSQQQVDQKAAEKLIDEKTALMNKQMKAQAAHMAAVKKVLTEEQLLQLEQRRMNRQFAGKNGRFGRRGPNNCPNPRYGYRQGFRNQGMNF
jgi:Spy/CpxP family protein refolding chaperone